MNWNNVTPSCDPDTLQLYFYGLLQKLESRVGFELKVNSAFRTVEYEQSKGRPGTSSHCKGLAVDISCNNSRNRALICREAFALGIDRIGIYKTFIHLDIDHDKVFPCIWLG